MDTIHEVIEFCKEKNNIGALLITGKWGCGKTYLVEHEIMGEVHSEIKDNFVPIRVSIFGETSAAAIHRKIKQAYYISKFHFGKNAVETGSKLKKSLATIANVIGEFNSIGKAAGSLMSFDVFDFIDVAEDIKEGFKLLLIIDDLERASLDFTQLLGCLNEYIENKKIKTILIANEETISDVADDNQREKYKKFKEKIVFRTIQHVPDYSGIINDILVAYKEKETGYQAFLKSNSALLERLFVRSKVNNIRSLKYGLQDFERVYSCIVEKNLKTDDTTKVLAGFLSLKFEVCNNDYPSAIKLSEKYVELENKDVLRSLQRWLLNGVWIRDDLLLELEQYLPKDISISIDEKILYSGLLQLEYNDLLKGFPIIIDKAYSGVLELDEYYKLFNLRLEASNCGIQLPIDIDYKKILAAVSRKIESIKQGAEPPSKIRYYIDDETQRLLNADELVIYRLINNYKKFEQHYINRTFYIEAHRNGDTAQIYECERKYYKSFDNEMCQVVYEYLSHSNNSDRHQYGFSFLNTWQVHSITVKEDLVETKDNIRKLANLIRGNNSGDNITKAINTILINKLDTLEIEYDQRVIDVERSA